MVLGVHGERNRLSPAPVEHGRNDAGNPKPAIDVLAAGCAAFCFDQDLRHEIQLLANQTKRSLTLVSS